MKKRTLISASVLLFAIALLLGAQAASTLYVPIWTGSYYTWPKLGPTLAVSPDGALNVVQAPPGPTRHYDQLLAADAKNCYPLPAGAANVAVWRNGLHQHAGVDFTLSSGVVTPAYPWTPGADQVTADYDQQ